MNQNENFDRGFEQGKEELTPDVQSTATVPPKSLSSVNMDTG